MYIEFAQFILLTFIIICCIYLTHISNLHVIREQVKGEVANKQFMEVNGKMNDILTSFRENNSMLENVLRIEKEKGIMCFKDNTKECDACKGDCPYQRVVR